MDLQTPGFLLEKVSFLKRTGYALITISIIFLTFMAMTPELYTPSLVLYSYILLVAGFLLLIVNKAVSLLLQARLRRQRAYCISCGWHGMGGDLYGYEFCPECDSEQVMIR
jgi:hypothetical protein